MTIEFDCPDCGWHVFRYANGTEGLNLGGRDAPLASREVSETTLRCRACEWLASIDDPVERAEARKTTHLVWTDHLKRIAIH